MEELLPFAGSWFWWIAAAVLLLLEMIMPGFFMLWLAFAAGLTAIADQIFHFGWMSEVFTFALLSLASILSSWRFVMNQRYRKSDSPHLNQRQNAFIGKTYFLVEPIVHGSGKIKVEDALWDVDGDDLAKGGRVKVTAVDGLRLKVEPA